MLRFTLIRLSPNDISVGIVARYDMALYKKGTRELDFTERQDIWTGPVQDMSITDQGVGPAWQRQLGAGAG